MACWSGRAVRPELLDSIDENAAAGSLRDLVLINRLLGGHRIIRSLFRALEYPGSRFSVLDIGAASGDMGAALRCEFPGCTPVSLDRVPHHLKAARPPRVAGDAFALPFGPDSFDYVTCSLFLHHFPNDGVVELLSQFRRVARRAVVIIDLERAPLLYYSLPLAGMLLRWDPVTQHDSRRSAEAGFHPSEFEQFARSIGASDYRVQRHAPWFRLSLVARA